MNVNEPTNIGLSEDAHTMLSRLKEEGHFREMVDAYRVGVALALANGVFPPEIVARRNTFGVSTVDPDRLLKLAVELIMGDEIKDEPTYRVVERLADWGVRTLYALQESGDFDFVTLLDEVRGVASVGSAS